MKCSTSTNYDVRVHVRVTLILCTQMWMMFYIYCRKSMQGMHLDFISLTTCWRYSGSVEKWPIFRSAMSLCVYRVDAHCCPVSEYVYSIWEMNIVGQASFYSPVHVLRVADTVCFTCFLVYIVIHVLFLDCVDCRLHTGCKCKNLCWPSGLNLQWCIQNVGWSWKGRDSRCLCNTRSAYVCYGRTVPSTYVACMCLEVNTTVKCCMCTFTAQ